MVGRHRSSVAPVDLCNHCATSTHPFRPRAEAVTLNFLIVFSATRMNLFPSQEQISHLKRDFPLIRARQ